jgi:hypothetical protein
VKISLTKAEAEDLKLIASFSITVPKAVTKQLRKYGEKISQERVERLSESIGGVWLKLESGLTK